jgi:prevent-host-death family protein
VVSALSARANFGKLPDRVEGESRSLVIEKRGTPEAVLVSIRDYVKMAAPEPEVLRIISEDSQRNGTNTSRQIDQVIKATRALMRAFPCVLNSLNDRSCRRALGAAQLR